MSRNNPTYYRDEELGAALRELEVPEHRPGFYAELDRRLAEESVARIADARRRLRARRIRLRWGLRVAAVGVVAAIVLFAIGIPRTERTPRIAGPEVATAAEIKAKVRVALTSMRNLSGVFVFDGSEKGDVRRWRFALSAEGDFRLIGPTEEERIVYDASAGVARSTQTSASIGGETLFYAVRRGVAPGPPDQGPPTWILPDEFGAFVRALLAAEDPRVREITYGGRPAWRLDIDTVPNAIVPEFSGDRLEITVDRGTGIPVRVVERKNGAFLEEIRIESLAVDADLPPDTFTLEFPAGAEVMRSDDGFRRMRLRDVATIVGYPPLVPAWVPEGYELTETAVAKESAPTGTEAANPPSRMVVSLSYRRGLDQFLVTTRLSGVPSELEPELPPEEVWGDPLARGEGFIDDGEQLTIGRGALAGEEAELVIVPRGIPHLWALTDELVVTVGGDLSRAELVRVTESLRRR
jgi:hypothetical protein